MHLKSTFFIKLYFFCWSPKSPLEFPDVKTFRGPSGIPPGSCEPAGKKRINDNEFDPKTPYFNSLIKTVINRRYNLNDSFEEILNLLDIRINESSAWTVDQIDGLYINTSNYEPLLGGSYIPLPKVLNNSMKGLI